MELSPRSRENAERSGFGSHPDLTSFDRDVLRGIWGEDPHCVLSPDRKAEKFHHIIGGYGSNKQRRDVRIFLSSPYNACPLSRSILRHCTLLRHRGMQLALLSATYKNVTNAIEKGLYVRTDNDIRFLRLFYLPLASWLIVHRSTKTNTHPDDESAESHEKNEETISTAELKTASREVISLSRPLIDKSIGNHW